MSPTNIHLDLSMSVFQAHRVYDAGTIVIAKKAEASRGAALLGLAGSFCLVGMKACAIAHFW